MKKRRPGSPGREAFSLVELVLIVAIMLVLLAIAVPILPSGVLGKADAYGTARMIASDIRLTRRLAITNASQNSSGYALILTPSSPYQNYKIVDLSTGGTVGEVKAIPAGVICTGDNQFPFEPLGNLNLPSPPQLTFSKGGYQCTLSVTTATGRVVITK